MERFRRLTRYSTGFSLGFFINLGFFTYFGVNPRSIFTCALLSIGNGVITAAWANARD